MENKGIGRMGGNLSSLGKITSGEMPLTSLPQGQTTPPSAPASDTPAKDTSQFSDNISDADTGDSDLNIDALLGQNKSSTENSGEAGKTEKSKEAKTDELMKKLDELQKKLENLINMAQFQIQVGDKDGYEKTLKKIDGVQKAMDKLLNAATGGGTPADSAGSSPGNTSGDSTPSSSGGSMPSSGGQSAHPEGPGGLPRFYPRGPHPDGHPQVPSPAKNSSEPRTESVVNDNTPVKGRPNGVKEIYNTFGPPGTNQVTTKMPAGPGGKMINVTCNAKIADKMKGAFEEIKAKGLSNEIKSFDGAFCNRNKRGGSSKSVHAWGIAFDVNASQNPMGSTRQTAGQRQLAAIFEKHGFHQLKNDPMHFQYATGY